MAVRLFFASLIVLLVFIGCGGGGGGGGSGSGLLPGAPVVVSGTISGTITIDQTISSLRSEVGSFSPSLRFLDAFVMIEELPNVSTRADQEGKFVFENIPFGTYRIIARVTSLSGRMYKLRTIAQSLSQADPQKNVAISVTPPDLAENQIRMIIKDLNDNPVGKCKVWFWGEQFTLDASGYYLSPYMPAGATGIIKVEPPADKKLSGLEFNIPATTFNPDNIEIIGITLPTADITNKAPIVSITTGKYPEEGSAFLRLFGHYSDPEGEPMTTSWLTDVSTFSYVAKDYADWAVPSISASVTVYFSASEDGKYYPRLTSVANLNINVASSGEVSFPGEILLRPVSRTVDIVGSATAQIPGNTVAMYEAKPKFPPGLALSYLWTADRGTMISSATESILTWRSPALAPGVTQLASITLAVTDGIGTASKEIQVRVTSAPSVTITQPTATAFEPGFIVFAGVARDYLNTAISPDSMKWYVATDTDPLILGQTGGATFTWKFLSQGSYTIALEAYDSSAVVGTGSKEIKIINGRPVCAITQPLNDASFRPDTPVTFIGTVNDLEDGPITDATALIWTSDIDGVIGSGTSFTVASLTSSRHAIRFSATDSGGAVGSTSIVIWYDVPARITFTPADRAVFFAGYNIPFSAIGTDTDNTTLDSSQFTWYLDDSPDIWRNGASFSVSAGAFVPGAHRIRVEGPAQFETAISPTQVIQMGWPVASITIPASGTRFEPLDVVLFTAVPDSTGTLSLQWYLNSDPVNFGSGAIANYAPPNGAHQVTYVGGDSQGIISSSTINIVVERIPIVSFFPVTGSYLFTGRPIEFDATCLDSDNNDITNDRVSWLLDGNPWSAASGKIFSLDQPAQLAAGAYQMTLIATGPYGTVGAITNAVTTGVPVAKIITPANNQTFAPGINIDFTGVPNSTGPILMEWWATYGASAPMRIGDGSAVATNTLPNGYPMITYSGTDSSGFASSHTIRIGVGEFPEMDFTPDTGTVFFGSHDVVFSGVGTDSIDGTVPGSRMAWYIDGVLELASYSVLTIEPARISVLGAGLKEVELRGYNTLGAVGSTVKKSYLGVQNAAITSPAPDTVIPSASAYNFTALPDSITGAEITDDLDMDWWLNYSLPGAAYLGSGQSLTDTLPDGIQHLTYIGTDSQGICSSATIRVIVSNSPAINFTPANGSQLFVSRPFDLTIGGAIDPASVKWSLDGGVTVWKTVSPTTVAPGELPVGTSNITAEGENLLGVAASITNSIYYGVALASITVPASGEEYPIVSPANTPVTFAAMPVPSGQVTMRWYRDDGGGAVYMGNSDTLAGYAMPQGRHTITYVGSDSVGFISSASIQILINDPPPMEAIPGNGSIFFAGRPVSFIGSGTSVISGLPVASTTMKWYLDTASSKTGSPITYTTIEQVAGVHALQVSGVDGYGTIGTSTAVSIKFGQQVASITFPASGSRYDVGDPVTLTGLPGSEGPITMEWYRDGVPGSFANDSNPAAQTFPAGLHTIRYVGTDSADFCSSGTIQILINDIPGMEITPGNNSIFFAGRPVTFNGSGTTSTGNPVATATMKWYLNGSPTVSYAGAPFILGATALSAGAHTIKLEGADEYGVKSSVINNFEFRYPLAGISSPASGTMYASGTAVLFTSLVDSHPDMQFQWWHDIDTAGATYMGAGQNITYGFPYVPYGLHTITYLATDSSGFVSSATIQILMNDRPNMLVTPGNGGIFFANRPVTIYGSGSSAVDIPINSSTFRWHVDGALKVALNGQGSPTFGSTELTAGTHDIMLLGSDIYGTTGTATVNLKFRQANASITLPASGSVYDPLFDTINFTGNPGSEAPITMNWYLNNEVLPFATDATANLFAPLVPTANIGWNTISYLGTDSASFCSSATIQLLINRPPTMNFTPGDGSIFFTGRPITLTGTGVSYSGPAIDTATMKWYVNGTYRAANSPVNLSTTWLANGWNIVSLSGIDSYGTVGTATYSLYYGYSLTSITAPLSGAIYPLTNNINFTAIPAASLPEIDPVWHLDTWYIGSGNSLNIVNLSAGMHTVTYLASDSSGYISSSTIQVLVNDTPTLVYSPGENSVFFAGQPVTFVGEGTSTANVSVATPTMKWYLNGSTTAIRTGSPVTFSAGQLLNGANSLKLTGTDEFSVTGEATYYSLRYGVQTANITYPASGTTLAIATLASFTAVPEQILPGFTSNWYHETGAGSPAILGAGESINNISLAAGWHTIKYLATDSSGFVSSATIMLLKNDPPVLTVNPASSSVFFTGRPVTLYGYGTDSANLAIDPATMKWYVNGGTTPLKTDSPVTFNVGQLINGNNVIKVTGEDSYGTVGEVLCNITYGYALSSITSPASGTTMPTGSLVNFTGSPLSDGSTIVMEWWRDDGIGVPVLMGANSPLSNIAVPAGRHTITYLGTDSASFCSSSTIQILLNDTPTITFAPPADGLSQALIFAGKAFTLEATGTPVVNDATFKWYKDGSASLWKSASPVVVNAGELTGGWHDVRGSGEDAYGTRGTGTHQIYYGHPLPSIVSPSSGSTFTRGSSPVFTGSAASAGVDVRWYLDSVDTFNTTQNYSAALPDGWNTVSYHATDSAGNLGLATTMVLMNDPPTLTFAPAHNSVVFTGRSFKLAATGTESIPPSPYIGTAGMKWYRDAVTSTFKTGSPATVNAGDLTVGSHTFYVAGPDQHGTVGTSSVQEIYYGHPLVSISSPASGTRFTRGSTVSFTGSAVTGGVALRWYRGSIDTLNTTQNYSFALPDGWNTISYHATDSAGNLSSATTMVLMNNEPTMKFLPGAGSRFFTGTAVTFTNDNSISGDGATPVASNTMNWHLDGAGAPTRSATATAYFSSGQLSATTHSLRLAGTDQYGIASSTTLSFYYGNALAAISSPLPGTRYNIGANVPLSGTPDSVLPITMKWYYDYGLLSEVDPGLAGAGVHNVSFAQAARGYRSITYIGTDSAANISSKTVQILINTPPTMTIASPTVDGKYFGGQDLYFEGSGVNSSATPEIIPAASMTWYLGASTLKTGLSNFYATAAGIGTGPKTIKLEGKDEYGIASSVTHNIETGFALPKISIPASGTRFYQGQLATFTGTPNLTGKIPMTWRWVEGGVPLEFGSPLSPMAASDTLPRGWQTISYIGSDSAGTERSDNIMVLVASPPTFVTPATITAPVFAYGPEYGPPANRIPIHLVSQGNYNLTLQASAIDGGLAAIDTASMTWYLGAAYIGTGNSVNANFNAPGSFTVSVAARDNYGLVATSSLTFWIWEHEVYSGFTNAPAAIRAKSTSELVVADVGAASVLKLTRSTTTVETTRGDITAVATQTLAADLAGYTLVDFALTANNIYTLSSIAGAQHKFSEWKLADFTFMADIKTIPHGTGVSSLSNPLGLSVETGSAIYVADTGNGLIKKMDMAGTFYLESQSVGAPIGVDYVDANSVYVAASGDDQLQKFTAALNSGAAWSSTINATNATRFVKAASNNMYATDPANQKINVINASGDLLYSFGSAAYFTAPHGITITGVANAYDMYITDRTGNKIVRFRSNAW